MFIINMLFKKFRMFELLEYWTLNYSFFEF